MTAAHSAVLAWVAADYNALNIAVQLPRVEPRKIDVLIWERVTTETAETCQCGQRDTKIFIPTSLDPLAQARERERSVHSEASRVVPSPVRSEIVVVALVDGDHQGVREEISA